MILISKIGWIAAGLLLVLCIVFPAREITQSGLRHPPALASAAAGSVDQSATWFPFSPPRDSFRMDNPLDLRALNETQAGDNGFIQARGSQFVHAKTGQPIVFWGVNGPASKDRDGLRREARMLAKYGVNLVRIHQAFFDEKGELDLSRVRFALDAVEAFKREGIYSYFSIYFPLWLKPAPDSPFLPGYDGKSHPFAALFFNKEFQERYRSWWKTLLLTPGTNGKRLIDEPAVAGLEMVNEDSYFFWTFSSDRIPDQELGIVERQFGDWLANRHGSLAGAFQSWGGSKLVGDNLVGGRAGFRPLWNVAHERTRRDQDTVRFLLNSQRGFYHETMAYLRGLGFRGLVSASNWTTADPRVLGPVEKYSYTVGDCIDRHGYFGCGHQGPDAAWSIRSGHTYIDRSCLRFDPEEPGKPRQFVNPVMDPTYDNKPSMISETTFNRPNRYRSEAPLYYAAYGALQGTDALVHFTLDGPTWSVQPGYFMQPWTIMSPAMMGQFPVAARIFRQGLIGSGELLADVNLRLDDVLALKGTPLIQGAALDELRQKDGASGREAEPGGIVDPLTHYAGRTNVNFTTSAEATSRIANLTKLIDRYRRVVQSSTGELKLDYARGVLTIDAPRVQGVCGALDRAGTKDLRDLLITSRMSPGHIVVVSLDGQPLSTSKRMLLQVMSEEKASGFQTESMADGANRITDIGRDPWLVRSLEGSVHLKRADADRLRVTALDFNGDPGEDAGSAATITLRPDRVYYLLQSAGPGKEARAK